MSSTPFQSCRSRAGVLLAALLLAGGANAAAPANDDISGAIAVTQLGSALQYDFYGATAANGDPAACPNVYAPHLYNTLWYSFTPQVTGSYDVELYADTGGSYLGVFTGTPGALSSVSCHDSAYPSPTVARFTATAGVTYTIEAAMSFEITYSAPGTIQVVNTPAPNEGTLGLADTEVSAFPYAFPTPEGFYRGNLVAMDIEVTCELPVPEISVHAQLTQGSLTSAQIVGVPCTGGSGHLRVRMWSPGSTQQYQWQDGPATVTLTGTEYLSNYNVSSGPIAITIDAKP